MRFSNSIVRPLLLGSAVACLNIGQIHASGFALIENGASGQGNDYAGVAAHVVDASTVFFNPAGMMRLEKDQFNIAGHYIKPSSIFYKPRVNFCCGFE
jgi:long-chain fatty acid transport protein